MEELEKTVLSLRKHLNKLEDKGYYNLKSLTRKDIRKYARLNNLLSNLYKKLNA